MRYRLKQIEIEAFRGVRNPLKIPLDSPLVVIFAPNGAGKSTLTAAIEWALFPQEAVRLGAHEIRERTNWEIRHIHGDEKPCVRLTLTDGSKDLVIEQGGAKTKKKRSQQSDKRASFNGTYADFKGLAYVHQESIRDFLIGQPKAREETFQRLLGAGWVQNLAEGVDDAARQLGCDRADTRVEALNAHLDARMQEAARVLKGEEEAAWQVGLKKPWAEEGQKQVNGIVSKINDLCMQLGIPTPEAQERNDFKHYSSSLRPLLNNLRKQGPAGKHTEFSTQKTKLQVAGSSFKAALDTRNDKKRQLEEKEKEVGTIERVQQRIQTLTEQRASLEVSLTDISREHSIMRAALDYFTGSALVKPCPACLRDGIPVDIVKRLKQRLEIECTTQETGFQQEINAISGKLKKVNQDQKDLNILANDSADAETHYSNQLKTLETNLGRELRTDESPVQVADAEIERLANEIDELSQAVTELQNTTNGIEEEGRKVDRIGEVLALQKRVDSLGQIRDMSEWKIMIEQQQSLAKQEQRYKIGSNVVRQFAAKLAEQNLERARQPITTIYRQLTSREDFPNISIDPQKKYAIEVSGNSGSQMVTAILNQTDMDALAIAVVAGMSTTFPEVHDFDFLIMDDPSQGMDPEVTVRLTDVIGLICDRTQVVITTPDPVMFQALKKSTKKKKFIQLKARDPKSTAPFVQLESVSGD